MNEKITININLMDPEECGCISWDGENICPHQVAVEKTCSEMAQHRRNLSEFRWAGCLSDAGGKSSKSSVLCCKESQLL